MLTTMRTTTTKTILQLPTHKRRPKQTIRTRVEVEAAVALQQVGQVEAQRRQLKRIEVEVEEEVEEDEEVEE